MQGQDTPSTNVVSLFTSKDKDDSASQTMKSEAMKADGTEDKNYFNDVMKQNQKNKERLERERANANKSVLRSYRIKH